MIIEKEWGTFAYKASYKGKVIYGASLLDAIKRMLNELRTARDLKINFNLNG